MIILLCNGDDINTSVGLANTLLSAAVAWHIAAGHLLADRQADAQGRRGLAPNVGAVYRK
jgi:hypothetical protein